jgi:hypothetical protein
MWDEGPLGICWMHWVMIAVWLIVGACICFWPT